MKLYIIALSALVMIGCAKPIPPEAPKPEVIVVTPVAHKEAVVQEEQPVEVLETWYTEESNSKRLQDYAKLSAAIEEATRKGNCMCRPGDPVCDCLEN